jgi:hypothetical protein
LRRAVVLAAGLRPLLIPEWLGSMSAEG